MILFGRYMTALCPSNGLVPTVVQVACRRVEGARDRVRAGVEDRPSESTNMNG